MNFVKYILREAKDKRISKRDALDLLRDFHSENDNKLDIIQPLLHKNISDLYGLRFQTTFSGEEFFLSGHVINGQRVLPGVAYLEMARAAAEQVIGAAEDDKVEMYLKNVVWMRPITVRDQGIHTYIRMLSGENDDIEYEIYSEYEDGTELVHGRGTAVMKKAEEVQTLDIRALQAECNQNVITPEQLYRIYKDLGIEYGSSHQGVEKIYVGKGQVLAKLAMPSTILNTEQQYILHPSIMDSALQASLGLKMATEDANEKASLKLSLPFALDELVVHSQCTTSMWVLIKHNKDNTKGDRVEKLNFILCDEQGKVCIRMNGFSSRVLENKEDIFGSPSANEILMFAPSWKEQTISGSGQAPVYEKCLIILCGMDGVSRESIEMGIQNGKCSVLQSLKPGMSEQYEEYAVQVMELIKEIFEEKPKGKVLLQIVVPTPKDGGSLSGLAGMLKTAQFENPKLICQMIELDLDGGSKEANKELLAKLQENNTSPIESRIRYQEGKRLVCCWNEVQDSYVSDIPWKERGIYLITGGAGGLGLIFAEEIAEQVKKATLILTGRSPMNEEKLAKIKELGGQGVCIEYKQVDVTDKQAVDELIMNIQGEFGRLNGIIHSAGVNRDNYILKKTKEEMLGVLAPKVVGLLNLDEASKDLPLDFFILFSSVAGCVGNPGQVDYAAGNAFMDAYAEYRNTLVTSRQRFGRTLSINWPLWREGGMHIDARTEQMMEQSTGLAALQTNDGIQAFYQAFASGMNQVMVAVGNKEKIFSLVGLDSEQELLPADNMESNESSIPENVTTNRKELQEKAGGYFKTLLSSEIKLPVHRIEEDAPMDKYGIDSVMVMQMTSKLEEVFGPISKTLFFEYQTIRELTGYFLDTYSDQLSQLLGIGASEVAAVAEESTPVIVSPVKPAPPVKRRKKLFAPIREKAKESQSEAMDIAIIGLAGKYPQARDIAEYWDNLKNGKDCITEIPRDRWDHSLYFDKDKNKPGKTYSKWGGFIDGVYDFDPLFFNISPREAEITDPQERLFLQCAYETLEDAGYTKEICSQYKGFGLEGNIGVFVGVMYEEYQLYGAQDQAQGRMVAVNGNPASIANRVSYYFNFHGPSMAIDTMCSSSLTAIHLACQSLQRTGCEMAIAGGVNISIHPNKYLLLGQGKFVSSKGRCESFGEGGDGYVPGEGVGAVLLKPLSKAIADGDHIYGVIKGTAINHGGKTNGYTVPNPNAQAEVIRRAYKESGINPRTVSYIEAHGTGTSLGDPIEIAGLSKTFREYTQDKQFCKIGSAKSNIGHCESAAGIAGLTKILLQMKYRQLVPSLHSGVLNPNIDFTDTPFIVQQELEEWERPVIELDGIAKECPRLAGISAFGAGGANAHVVIEEYIPKQGATSYRAPHTNNRAIIVLSAKSEGQLQEKVGQFIKVIHDQQFSDAELADMAYTLQVGREAMKERLAFVVNSIEDLEEKLQRYLNGGSAEITEFYRGQVSKEKETLSVFDADEDLQKAIDSWIAKGKYGKLLDLWAKGLIFDWNRLYPKTGNAPQRTSLPTYPFAKDRYWIQEASITTGAAAPYGKSMLPMQTLHPLLHQNISDFNGQRYRSIFTGEEFFIKAHVINEQRLLPAVAYLEMARAAIKSALGDDQEEAAIYLKNIAWTRPVTVEDEPVQIEIELYPEENGEISYEIYSEDTDPIVYSEGRAELKAWGEPRMMDIKSKLSQCNRAQLSAEQCYETLRRIGFNYDQEQQGIEKLYLGENQVIAELRLPASVQQTQTEYVLHPSLMDSAIQATIGLMITRGEIRALVPFALQELAILDGNPAPKWVFINPSSGNQSGDNIKKLDIELCDETGKICVQMKGLTIKEYEKVTPLKKVVPETIMLSPDWKEVPADKTTTFKYNRHLVVLCETQEINHTELSERMKGIAEDTQCLTLEAEGKTIDQRYQEHTVQIFEEIKKILAEKSNKKNLVQVIVSDRGEEHLHAGLVGLIKTAEQENPKLIGQIIQISYGEASASIIGKIIENSQNPEDKQISYQNEKRGILGWREITNVEELNEKPWKDNGNYLITGGAGGLGLIFATEIAGQVKSPTIVISGRRSLSKEKQTQFQEIEKLGARVVYKQVDVTNENAVRKLFQEIKEEYGDINGIIHSAGVNRDNYIYKKTKEEMLEVLAPKVAGLLNLDKASKELPLDLFILFSSVTGSLGNPGQSDYAAANAFLDTYAKHRNTLVAFRQRFGKTLSINWPLWREGGMHIDTETESMIEQNTGLTAIQTNDGIQAFYQAFASGWDQVMVASGNKGKILSLVGLNSEVEKPLNEGMENKGTSLSDDGFYQKLLLDIVEGSLSEKQFTDLIKI